MKIDKYFGIDTDQEDLIKNIRLTIKNNNIQTLNVKRNKNILTLTLDNRGRKWKVIFNQENCFKKLVTNCITHLIECELINKTKYLVLKIDLNHLLLECERKSLLEPIKNMKEV